MARGYSYEDDQYSIRVQETDGHIDLHLQIKKQQPISFPQPDRHGGRGQRVVVPAHEHMRRQGTQEDDMVILDHGDGCYEVSSRTEPGSFHIVMVDEKGQETCQCTAATYGRLCRHVKGVRVLRGLPLDAPLRQSQSDMPSTQEITLRLTGEPSD